MTNFDNSRLADLKLINERLNDKRTTRRGKRLLERSKAAIQAQERDPWLKSTRTQLLKATQAGDASAVTKLSEQLADYDKRKGYDQRET